MQLVWPDTVYSAKCKMITKGQESKTKACVVLRLFPTFSYSGFVYDDT